VTSGVAISDHPSSSDDRLDAIVAEYYDARDAGRPLTVDELAARHPDLASHIRQFIGDIERVAAVLQHRPNSEPRALPRPGSVGRYAPPQTLHRSLPGEAYGWQLLRIRHRLKI
jgi:hypothetical protein